VQNAMEAAGKVCFRAVQNAAVRETARFAKVRANNLNDSVKTLKEKSFRVYI
jgi:hypothetical protein